MVLKEQKVMVDGYVELFSLISEKTKDDSVALAIFCEVAKDIRMKKIHQAKKTDSKNGDRPASEKQLQFLKNLVSEDVVIPEGLTSKQASELIDESLAKQD